MPQSPILAFDVGGSFVKAGLVDATAGRVAGEVLRRATPADAAPEAVIELLATMARASGALSSGAWNLSAAARIRRATVMERADSSRSSMRRRSPRAIAFTRRRPVASPISNLRISIPNSTG